MIWAVLIVDPRCWNWVPAVGSDLNGLTGETAYWVSWLFLGFQVMRPDPTGKRLSFG